MKLRPLLILMALLAVSARVEATPPTPMDEALFDTAERDGAPSVRQKFDRTTFGLLRQVDQASGRPRKAGFRNDDSLLGEVAMWSRTWIDTEVEQILKDGQTPDSFERDVWRPLFRIWTDFRLCTDQLDAIRVARNSSPLELKYAQNRVKQLIEAADVELPYKLAALAAVADRPDLVQEILLANAGEIREPERIGDPDFQGRSYASVSAFMEIDHAGRHRRTVVRYKCRLPACIVPPQPETWAQTIHRWRRPLAALVLLIVGPVVLWNRKVLRHILFP